MSKHELFRQELESKKTGKMKCFGNSMLPIIKSGSILTFEKRDDYFVGDIVFCKVKGRFIEAHKIKKKDNGRYLIANNKGYENGWTRSVFGKVIKINGKDLT